MNAWTARLAPLFVLTLATGSCGSAPAGHDAAARTVDGRACAPGSRIGGFAVNLFRDETSLDGEVVERHLQVKILEEIGRDGACRLIRSTNPFCDPGCASRQACSYEQRCVSLPAAVSVGEVRVDGLARPVTMHPRPPGQTYFDTTLPHPGVLPGAAVVLEASGGPVPSFTLRAVGVEPISAATASVTLTRGQPLVVDWHGGTTGAPMQLRVLIDQHGLTPVTLTCDVADTGAFAIPAVLVDQLLAQGVSGVPSVELDRSTAGSAELPTGCVDLVVNAQLGRRLVVEP
jgi:hypothetical protein